jgi:hypothetical protein
MVTTFLFELDRLTLANHKQVTDYRSVLAGITTS